MMGDHFSEQNLAIAGLVVLVAFLFFVKNFLQTKDGGNKDYPPVYAGWIPWIGCAVEFGKAPLQFIEQKRKEMGSVYTLLITGERMTFLLDHDHFHHFFQSSNVDFQVALQKPVQNIALVSSDSFFTCHTQIHDMVKGKLAASNLSGLFASLNEGFAKGLDKIATGDYELNGTVRRIMYRAVLDNLFGKGTLPTDDEAVFKQVEKHFVKFDDQFEYGAKLPPFFLREWSDSRAWLLDMFHEVVVKMRSRGKGDKQETVLQSLLNLVDAAHAPNYSLLLMWASLANAIPITFWTLALVMSHEEVAKKARREVVDNIGTTEPVTMESLSSLPYLKCCILEAIRLRSPGIITRRVIKPIKTKELTIPAGDMVMVSPYWAHRNPKLFPDPDNFNPERWESCDLEKNVFLEGFIGFGGGRFQCPGRWFALMELHMFLALFLRRFDCQMKGPIPDISTLHLVGTQQPMGPCNVYLKRL